jgi:Uma2 family endonuclease
VTTGTLSPPPLLDKRLFTVEEVLRLDELGFFGQDERVELIDGEIVRMTPIGKRHGAAVVRLNLLFARLAVEGRGLVSVQNPAFMDSLNLPQPDVCLTGMRALKEVDHPRPGDITLLIEVAETTLRMDREVKLPLYARAAIVEYWIANLQADLLEVYRDPDPESGAYRQRLTLPKNESIAPLAFPDFPIPVSDMLP